MTQQYHFQAEAADIFKNREQRVALNVRVSSWQLLLQ